MKSPVTEVEIRWRRVGDTGGWQSRRYLPGAKIQIREIERASEYVVEARSIGVGQLVSEWVPATVTVRPTNRTGALALPTNVVGNQASMWDVDTSVTYAAVSDASGNSEATISVSAGTLVIGGATINYGASSATVTGAADGTLRVYLYYDDPRWQGGSRPLGVTTSIVESANVPGRVAITSLLLTFPPAGESGGGGGGIGGGGGGGGAHQPPETGTQPI